MDDSNTFKPTWEKKQVKEKKKAIDNYVHHNDVGNLEPDTKEENRKHNDPCLDIVKAQCIVIQHYRP